MSNILQDIFKDNYERMIYTLHPRKSVIENVDRMINCGDPSFGGAMYGCGKCGTLKFVPFRCHSRFCPTCGTKYSIDRTTSMSFKIINVQHRHCVFTIDSELRHFFLEDRELLGLLFEAVQSVILRMFHKDNKTEKFTPGFILVLHTFGRDLKWKQCCCWAHIRRYLLEAIPKGHQKDYSNPAVQGVLYCNKLFEYERSYKEKEYSVKQIYNRRLKDEKPVIEAFLLWLKQVNPGSNGKLKTAITYIKNREEFLMTYLEDGQCSLSNNLSENSIRPVTVGRKN